MADPSPLRLAADMVEAMVQHARFTDPDEACGLLAVDGDGAVRMVYCCTNVEASPYRYTVDPVEHYHAWRHAAARGWDIGGVFHSHPRSEPIPSATDVAGALDPRWWYLIVGGATVRAFRIGGEVREVPVVVAG